jgi:hypothetical protein
MEFVTEATTNGDVPNATASVVAAAAALEHEPENQLIGKKLAPYNPTNLDACHLALDMLELNSTDVFYDLGCGDGRLLVEVSCWHGIAAKHCCIALLHSFIYKVDSGSWDALHYMQYMYYMQCMYYIAYITCNK